MSKIKWNEITWYSRMVTMIFFIGILPVVTFVMGVHFERAQVEMGGERMVQSVVFGSSTEDALRVQRHSAVVEEMQTVPSIPTSASSQPFNYETDTLAPF